MKKKIIGIFVCMLMIATTIVTATNVKEEKIETSSYKVDVPIWEVGDSWTYNEHYNEFTYGDEGEVLLAWYHNCTSTYTVTNTTGDSYTVKLTSKNNEGSFIIGPFRCLFQVFIEHCQIFSDSCKFDRYGRKTGQHTKSDIRTNLCKAGKPIIDCCFRKSEY